MKKIRILLICFSIMVLTAACEKEYSGEYVQWGDIESVVDKAKLKENDIPYKIQDNKVYIPKKARSRSTKAHSILFILP